jgi:hypothetical protein
VIITRNKADYSASEIAVLSPDEFLVLRGLSNRDKLDPPTEK